MNSNNPNEDFYGVSDSFVIGVYEGSEICEFPLRLAIFMSNEEQFDERHYQYVWLKFYSLVNEERTKLFWTSD